MTILDKDVTLVVPTDEFAVAQDNLVLRIEHCDADGMHETPIRVELDNGVFTLEDFCDVQTLFTLLFDHFTQ